MASRTPSATRVRRHSGVSLSGAEPVPAASEAEVPRSLEVGTDPCVALTDLGPLQVWMKCMEHRSMSFLSRVGTLVERATTRGSQDWERRRRREVSHRQVASGHTARGAWPAIFTLVSNIDMGTSFRVDGHDGAPPGCRSSEFRDGPLRHHFDAAVGGDGAHPSWLSTVTAPADGSGDARSRLIGEEVS